MAKKSSIGPALKKAAKVLLTLVLLAAVLLGAVIGLKTFGIFDAGKFLPFPLPFSSEPAQPPVPMQPPVDSGTAAQGTSTEQQAAASENGAQPVTDMNQRPTGEEQAALLKASNEQAEKAQDFKTPQVPPVAVREAIYITRTHRVKKGGERLENKIYEFAAKAGGNISGSAWKVMSTQNDKLRVTAAIPGKSGDLTYSFLVDKDKKTVEPDDEAAKAVYAALTAERIRKAPARPARKKAASKPAAKSKKAAPKAEVPADSEYEYVYVDEDGNEEPAR